MSRQLGAGGGGGGEYASEHTSFFRWTYTSETVFNTVMVTAVEAPMTRDDMHLLRGEIWVAMRDLLLGVENHSLSREQADAYDRMNWAIGRIDSSRRYNVPLLRSSLGAMPPRPPVVPGYDIQPVIPDADADLRDRKYEEFKEHYARTGSEESFERMLECVYIDE